MGPARDPEDAPATTRQGEPGPGQGSPGAGGSATAVAADGSAAHPFDLIVIGGGIIGTGVARDAVLRGLRVCVVEKEDYGWGTTARSTRLVHGGLRYLEYLDLGLVREALHERRILIKIAPHLVAPLPFLFPLFRGKGRRKTTLRLGLILYDLLAGRHIGTRHRWWRRKKVAEAVPSLDRPDLKGAFLFYDAQVPYPERLTVENVVDVRAQGGAARNHTEVVGLLMEDRVAKGVRVRDTLTGDEDTIHGRFVLNTAGPWVTEVDSRLGCRRPALTRRTKGVHLLVDPIVDHALVLQCGDGKRIVFVIPWQGYSLIGTTDTDYAGANETVRAVEDDVRYLLDEVNENLGVALKPEDVHHTWAGLRSLIHDVSGVEGAVSRRHQFIDHDRADGPVNLASVVGGKITAYRAIAADIVDRLATRLGTDAPSTTAKVPLPGGAPVDRTALLRTLGAALPHCTDQDIDRLLAIYGSRAIGLVDAARRHPGRVGPLHPGSRLMWEEVAFAVEEEQARTVEDVLLRRTMAGLERDQGLDVLEGVTAYMANLLGWDADRRVLEQARYRETVGRNRQAVEVLAGAYDPHMPDVRLADKPAARRRGRTRDAR